MVGHGWIISLRQGVIRAHSRTTTKAGLGMGVGGWRTYNRALAMGLRWMWCNWPPSSTDNAA